MKEYRKTATVKAKLFELGDQDGFEATPGHYFEKKEIPYIRTLENQKHQGEFGKHYLCVGIEGERWLVDRDIFEKTYIEC